MDARQRRSRARLTGAILELATERPADELSVSEVAERAGVHRSTFYEHAASPVDLLQSALREQLDELRERYLADTDETDVAAAVEAVTGAVLEHVDRHAVIYSRGLGAGSGAASLHAMLSSHFQESTRLLLQQRSFIIPIEIEGMSSDDVREMVVHFVGDGTVGALQVWLAMPSPRQVAPFLALYAQLVPSWWPLTGNAVPTASL